MEMKALRSQMNPHFLFNSINSIEHYIITNERDKAADYLNRFSRLMRLILQNSRSQKVPLSSELEALQLYVDLERIRFKVPFEYDIELEPSVNPNDVEIPPMLIQPFVENAIWHGIQHKNEKGNIVLSFIVEDELLICTIDDDGVGRKIASEYSKKSRKKHKSVGLKITEERISILNQRQGARASFTVIDKVDEMNNALGTRIVLKLPT
jgi:sensor histidine kinase YesM